ALRSFLDDQVALAAAVDIRDHDRALAFIWIAAANQRKLFAVRRKSYGRIDLLQHLDGNTAEHGDAIKRAGAEILFDRIVNLGPVRRKSDAEISDWRGR